MVTQWARRWTAAWGIVVVLGLGFAGCMQPDDDGTDDGDNPPAGTQRARLVPFNSPEELVRYYQQRVEVSGARGFEDFAGGGAEPAADEAAPEAPSAETPDFSTTNVQEAGVDESDVFKSDGTYFYLAKGASLRIVRANPLSDLAEVGRLDLDATIDSMYLFGSTLIVLAPDWTEVFGSDPGGVGGIAIPEIWPPYFARSSVLVYSVDVSDPATPQVTGQLRLDGSLVSSRLTNERVIVVLTVVSTTAAEAAGGSQSEIELTEVLPMAQTSAAERLMVDWPDVLHPEVPDGSYMTAIVTLDANEIERIVHSTAVMASASTIYASREALYLADGAYDEQFNYRETTAIHKFAFGDDGAARYVSSGTVPGRLLNQFSLGEHEDFLRVATHVSNFGVFIDEPGVGIAVGGGGVGSPGVAIDPARAQPLDPAQPYNAVYVLGEGESELEIVGRIEDIAPGERLYAARFLGTRGFLVTFQQIDPLFTLDLADPANPRLVGELEIPGFSEYLHPIDETHLIGVGRSVRDNGFGGVTPDAVLISLFDVSDFANPQVIEQIELGGPYSNSDVSYTHKAFTYLADSRLMAIPVQLAPTDANPFEYQGYAFEGIVCFRVDPAQGFEGVGSLEAVFADTGDFRYVDWRRAAFIDQSLYSVSSDGVNAAPLSDLSSATAVTLEPGPEDEPIYFDDLEPGEEGGETRPGGS